MNHRSCQGSGLWNAYPVSYSKETQNLLKLMMNEAKLTNLQQRNIAKSLSNGDSLPVKNTKNKSVEYNNNRVRNSKSLNPRNYSGGVRSRETIERLESAQSSFYRPSPVKTKDRQVEKDRLANLMAFGEDLNQNKSKDVDRSKDYVEHTPKSEVDRFDELISEIGDRRKFLQQMEDLGKGKEYRNIIETEISKLILEMEIIDKKRMNELEKQMKLHNYSKSS